jgi:hypothetical protein
MELVLLIALGVALAPVVAFVAFWAVIAAIYLVFGLCAFVYHLPEILGGLIVLVFGVFVGKPLERLVYAIFPKPVKKAT